MLFPLIRHYKRIFQFLAIALLLSGCSGIERSENEKTRRRNCKGEYVYRKHNEFAHAIVSPKFTPRTPYPWEGSLPRITKEFFRCKGNQANPPALHASDPTNPILQNDCEGSRHGLPIFKGEEGVYPILIELLNEVQKKTGKRVVITSGHRCPVHNTYIDPSKENRVSKHQIGAEVDFYVQGMEGSPLDVVQILIDSYKGQRGLENFQKFEKSWQNKEICIKLRTSSEGRNGDNQHPYPYLSLQVRWDRQSLELVSYEWKRAHLEYPRVN